MDRQPILIGERLEMRPLREDDWDALFAIASDAELWALHPMHDRWQEPVFRAFFADALAQGGALVGIERETGAVVSSSRFQGYLPANGGEVEIGWTFLARNRWGSGLNTEMKRLMLAHALGFVERVVFRVGDTNLRSRRAVEKIGGRLTDEVEVIEHEGRQLVHVIYEIRRADFASGPLSQG
ncbi:GNAT family protein [Alteraurantiacibacter aestuarii]|uniref:GNAT family N-acetyltransferase n=1 Tax=Alteraurantiacibacter aestuarii TaxID=650004 RepID=A0A844ZFY4_9SPHN|nr:GNAT family N-acetyltransferase [Alteraurantiacibacter aestuarii]MXO87431.1 GNAT family N-acetyltransferase [Alteraurantiacibacter aestuarii]